MRRGFSLLELVTVVVILGVIAAIAIPRAAMFSEAAAEAALQQDIAILTKAVEHYRAEHDGAKPTSAAQLTQYTDRAGNVSATPTATHIFGPYVLEMPSLGLGSNRGKRDVSSSQTPGADSDAGWVITDTGEVRANLADTELGASGVQLNTVGPGKLLRK